MSYNNVLIISGKIDDMTAYAYMCLHNFPGRMSEIRYSIKNLCIDLIKLSSRLEKKTRKTNILEEMDADIDSLRRLVRMSITVNPYCAALTPPISIKSGLHLISLIDEIGKMIGGFMKSEENKSK